MHHFFEILSNLKYHAKPYGMSCFFTRSFVHTHSLRLGCHALRIQTGKYENRGVSIPVEQRTCLICKQNCVEDEKHFLMYCQGFTTIQLCSNISKIDVSYIHFSENERTKYLLRADNKNT